MKIVKCENFDIGWAIWSGPMRNTAYKSYQAIFWKIKKCRKISVIYG